MDTNKSQCRLCGEYYLNKDMSEEHYPALSVGNEDLVELDIIKVCDSFGHKKMKTNILKRYMSGQELNNIDDDIFDKELSTTIYPLGRTARTLCIKCNTFLGKYDAVYLKFFSCDGNPKQIKGFKEDTKIQIIKSIFGKFLSVPEAQNEEFDFLNFLKDETEKKYYGQWKLYFIKRDLSTDLLGFKDIRTGKIVFDEGIVYELSDDKFIFNLMNFDKHECFPMTDIFEILNKNYVLLEGVGSNGGYHSQVFISSLFENNLEVE